jgi:transposase
VIAIADKAQQRLCRRFRRFAELHKPAPKIAVAIARELAGFLWAALHQRRRARTKARATTTSR